MNIIKHIGLLLIIFTLIEGNLFAQTPGQNVVFNAGKAEIVLEDHLHHPFYWWPNTLLNYPILFNEVVPIEELVLIDEQTGKQQPFQLTELEKTSEGKLKAVIHFMSDLPSGGKRVFTLKKGIPETCPAIRVESQGKEIMVQSDKLTVWIPSSQTGSSEETVPGPVSGIAQDVNKRMGQSHFNLEGRILKTIKSSVINQGALFTDVNVNYQFTDGANYQADIRCIKGYDFIEIKEEMNGFSDQEKCEWEIDWSGFSPLYRQAPNHPHFQNEPYLPATEKSGFGRYEWEKIDQKNLSGHTGLIYTNDSTKIPFSIDAFGNWPAEKIVTSTVFWDDKSMQSVGVFVNNVSGWDDKKYPVWFVSEKLSISFYYRNKQLLWKIPVVNGSRSTAISCYNHQKDIDYMNDLEQKYQPQQHPSGFTYRVHMSQLSHNTFLQNRYGTISLDKIKDWVLTYPDSLRAWTGYF